MLRSAGIRSKILAVLVVPLVLLAITTGLLGTSQVLRASEAYEVEDLAGAVAVLPQLTADLALERSTTKASLQGDAAAAGALPGVRTAVDDGVAAFQAALAEVDVDRLPGSVGRAVSDSAAAQDELVRLRTGVDDGSLLLGSSSAAFDTVLDAHLQLPGRIGPSLADQDTAAGLTGLGHLLVARDLYLDEQEIGLRLLGGSATTVDIADFRALGRAQTAELARWEFAVDAPEGAADDLDATGDLRGTAWSVASARTALSGAAGAVGASGLTPEVWLTTTTGRIDAVDVAVEDAVSAAVDSSGAASASATVLAAAAVLAAVVGVGVTVVLSLLLARRIARPLRELTAAATSVREQLPVMVEQMRSPGQMPDVQLPRIEVTSDDEVGRLAAAFNDVNDTVVQVAEEQAALRGSIAETFVNVARRNQVLLSRQLSFIDQLEQREENPDTLENLFRLDHLATRMRRNAESLLVLANIDAGRRLRQPLALSDVIRTAASEIEQYERVNLALQVDPPTMGHLSLQLAHLLAELLENGTNFSEPHTPVLVATSRTSTGIRITVTDEGLGLTDDEIETARAKISDFSADDVVTSQRLGFFVVGRLARRLGVTVTVRRGAAKGLVVTVDLPPSLFVPGTVKVADPDPATAARTQTDGPASQADRALAGAPGRAPLPAAPAAPAPGAAPGAPAPGAPSGRPQVPAARPAAQPTAQPTLPQQARPAAAQAPARPAPTVPARPTGVSLPMPGAAAGPDPTQAVTVAPGGITLPRRGQSAPSEAQPAAPATPAPAAGTAGVAPATTPTTAPTTAPTVAAPARPAAPVGDTGHLDEAPALTPVVVGGSATLPTRGRHEPAAGSPASSSAAPPAAAPAPVARATPAAAPDPSGPGSSDGSATVPELLDRSPAAALPGQADATAPPRRAGLFGAFRARREEAEQPARPEAGPGSPSGAPSDVSVVPPVTAPRVPAQAARNGSVSGAEPGPTGPSSAPVSPFPAALGTPATDAAAAPRAATPPAAAPPATTPSAAAPPAAALPAATLPAAVPSAAAPSAAALPAAAPPAAALSERRAAAVPPAAPAPAVAPAGPRSAAPAAAPAPASPAPASPSGPAARPGSPVAPQPSVQAPAPEPAPLTAAPVSILPGGTGARRRGRRSLFGPKVGAPGGAPAPVASSLPTAAPFPAPVQAPSARPATPVPAQGAGPARSAPPAGGAPGSGAPAGSPSGAPRAPADPAGGGGLPSRPPRAGSPGSSGAVGVPVAPSTADGEAVRQRSMLASEALSELSRLSSYSPSSVEGRGGPAPLVRRQPAATAAAKLPEKPVGPAPERRPRSAADVRSMLSGFQSGVTRGRAGGDAGDDAADTQVPGARVPVDSLTTTRSTTDTRTTD